VARFFGGVNFVPGLKKGRQVDTALGALACPETSTPDGPVTVTIRPENVVFDASGGSNPVSGQVRRSDYFGTHARFTVDTAAGALEAVTDSGQVSHVRPGQNITLHLPPEKIWLLPGPG
jgi:ABC-type sugar transport system ATPase subunit